MLTPTTQSQRGEISQMSRDKQLNNWLFSARNHHAIDADFAHRVLGAWFYGEIARRKAIKALISDGASAREAIGIIREIEQRK